MMFDTRYKILQGIINIYEPILQWFPSFKQYVVGLIWGYLELLIYWTTLLNIIITLFTSHLKINTQQRNNKHIPTSTIKSVCVLNVFRVFVFPLSNYFLGIFGMRNRTWTWLKTMTKLQISASWKSWTISY